MNDYRLGKFIMIVAAIVISAIIVVLAVSSQGCSVYATNPSEKKIEPVPEIITIYDWYYFDCAVELDTTYIRVWDRRYLDSRFVCQMFYYNGQLITGTSSPFGGTEHAAFSHTGTKWTDKLNMEGVLLFVVAVQNETRDDIIYFTFQTTYYSEDSLKLELLEIYW